MRRVVLELSDDQQALLVSGYGLALIRRETDGSVDVQYPEEVEADSRVSYFIEGSLAGKGWVSYATLGPMTQERASEVFRTWQESRDQSVPRMGIVYRLVRRTVTDEIVLSEREGKE